jgi:hypothetical protein
MSGHGSESLINHLMKFINKRMFPSGNNIKIAELYLLPLSNMILVININMLHIDFRRASVVAFAMVSVE